MADERDREHPGRSSSDAMKGEKAANPSPDASTEKDPSTPGKVETDMAIEDRFEATDN